MTKCFIKLILTLFPTFSFDPPENIRKPKVFDVFRRREIKKENWEENGKHIKDQWNWLVSIWWESRSVDSFYKMWTFATNTLQKQNDFKNNINFTLIKCPIVSAYAFLIATLRFVIPFNSAPCSLPENIWIAYT